ncbi:MAG: hypothetical protein U0872_06505 [Planctomycetaceae bacterium]
MPTGFLALALVASAQVGIEVPPDLVQAAAPSLGHAGFAEPRYPINAQQNWVHGYFQELPAHGGHSSFRPSNYQAVLAHSRAAAERGDSPVTPYSQQFWAKYHDRATMLKLSRSEAGRAIMPVAGDARLERSVKLPTVVPQADSSLWESAPRLR